MMSCSLLVLAPSLAVTFRVTVLLIAPRSWVLGGGDASELRALRLGGLVLGGLVLGGVVGEVEPPDPPEIFLTGLLRLGGVAWRQLSLESDELEEDRVAAGLGTYPPTLEGSLAGLSNILTLLLCSSTLFFSFSALSLPLLMALRNLSLVISSVLDELDDVD